MGHSSGAQQLSSSKAFVGVTKKSLEHQQPLLQRCTTAINLGMSSMRPVTCFKTAYDP